MGPAAIAILGQVRLASLGIQRSGPGRRANAVIPGLTGIEVRLCTRYRRPLTVPRHATRGRCSAHERAGLFLWTCTCGDEVIQLYGQPAPDELVSHPREHGQWRGER